MTFLPPSSVLDLLLPLLLLSGTALVVVTAVSAEAPLTVRKATNWLKPQLNGLFDETLKLDQIEAQLNSVAKPQTPLDSAAAAAEMADKLSLKFRESRKIVSDLKNVIEKTWKNEGQTSSPCCEFCVDRAADGDDDHHCHEYDNAFKNFVDRDSLCHNAAEEEVALMAVDPAVANKMKSNLNSKPTTKWQHFGTQTGFHVLYPASAMNAPSMCHDFDPRERPW